MKTTQLISIIVLAAAVMSQAYAATSSGTITFSATVIDSSKLCNVKFNSNKNDADKTIDTKSCHNSAVNFETRAVKVASKTTVESTETKIAKSVTKMSYL